MKLMPYAASRRVGRTVLKAKANSPHLFFGIGLVGTVASTVLACRATLKLRDALDNIESDIKDAEQMSDPKDKAYVYIRAGMQLGKLYAPAIIVGSVSVASLTGSHVQLTRRNTALMAAYATLQKAYDEYRVRVEAQLGDTKEKELYLGTETKDKKDGLPVVNLDGLSPYARFFDEVSREWKRDPELNRMYIECQQNWANQLLKMRGHVFLNEVYDSLDLERTSEGAVVGWVYPSKDGDNYISFGIHEARNSAFLQGSEPSILLDFNVDGVIFNLI
jgi:Family of unknown function (DUF6353)